MFTGIIRRVGVVRRIGSAAAGKRLVIDVGPIASELSAGDSLAVSGACLTAAAVDAPQAEFDVVAETLSRTTLGLLAIGAKVNLEQSLKVTDRLEGHMVQGHVDGVAEVASICRSGAGHTVLFAAADLARQMVSKGSVAVDGVSLTVVDLTAECFSVALIPSTLENTTLSDLAVGSKVNVEVDVIGKYVRRYLRQLARGGGLTLDRLKEAGFA
ncbi:MAG: riboflavin synthase [Planctomycetota bacterium]|jgi:riboflavin synthase